MIKQLNKSTVETVGRPVRILQFGEGNFLRAFVDWQIDIANEKGVMDAGVAVCQPIIDPERNVLGMIELRTMGSGSKRCRHERRYRRSETP